MQKLLLSIFTVLSLCATSTHAQKTFTYTDSKKAYKNGLELFDERNFLSARQRLEEIYLEKKQTTDNDNTVLMQNLEFYIAACATEMNDKDAELLLNNYYKKLIINLIQSY